MNENAPTLVTMYTTGSCPYCLNAKSLLSRLHAQVTEKRIDTNEAYREEMHARTNDARTVPQIFIGTPTRSWSPCSKSETPRATTARVFCSEGE